MELTPRCQIAIDHARRAQGHLGHPNLGSAHLVLGLLFLQGVGPQRLKGTGLSIESVQQYLASKQIANEESVEFGNSSFGKSAADALSRAEVEAEAFGHTYLGVEHLVLALLSEERGEAASLFSSVPVDRDAVRKIILQEMT